MTNFEKCKEEFTLTKNKDWVTDFCNVIHKIKNEKGCGGSTCRECNVWLRQEYKPPILDKAEKKYLFNIIRPFRDKVNYITKKIDGNKCEYITIVLHKCMGIFLPSFEGGTMYKGMELNKKYNLKELGL